MIRPLSLYFHIPFCLHRCGYCDFNTYAGLGHLIPAYTDALCDEVCAVARAAGERLAVHTIFFGGGTPSLLPALSFERILAATHDNFDLVEPEITLEANPGTVTPESLRDLHALGFNRLSLGAQSFQPHELRLLERMHDPFDLLHALEWARTAGFENVNLDLMYGLPGQTMSEWAFSLNMALRAKPWHLSLYALGIEAGTPFGRWVKRGLMPAPDADTVADLYEWSAEQLEAAGYKQYEISNWAMPGKECRHNLQYWRCDPYLGFGAGAHGYAAGLRYSNVKRVRDYLKRMQAARGDRPFPLSSASTTAESLSLREQMQETMMLGLRLTREGVRLDAFERKYGLSAKIAFGREIKTLLKNGLIVQQDGTLRLSRRGRLLGNHAFMQFVDSV